ncbi:hypothetical protein PIB30_070728 [Stylosanthes scabra]|uniref:Uncharacterized protein n=1 Tax=Stylosanthes scabra TaxID=79078 RepID=A0ABU6VQE2_9FABA|nr:hypothetical protein [Stylosanthes scabra]
MFQRPRTVAMEVENPGTYGTVLIYPLDRLVECGFVGDTAVNPWVGIFCRRQGFARMRPLGLMEGVDLPRFREPDRSLNRWTDWFKGLEVRPKSDRVRFDRFTVFDRSDANRFLHVNRTGQRIGSRFFRSNRPFRSGFQNTVIYSLDRLVECGFAGYMLNFYTWELVVFMGTHVISRSMA